MPNCPLSKNYFQSYRERERERGILLDLNISVKKFHLISQLEFETYIANFGLVR